MLYVLLNEILHHVVIRTFSGWCLCSWKWQLRKVCHVLRGCYSFCSLKKIKQCIILIKYICYRTSWSLHPFFLLFHILFYFISIYIILQIVTGEISHSIECVYDSLFLSLMFCIFNKGADWYCNTVFICFSKPLLVCIAYSNDSMVSDAVIMHIFTTQQEWNSRFISLLPLRLPELPCQCYLNGPGNCSNISNNNEV